MIQRWFKSLDAHIRGPGDSSTTMGPSVRSRAAARYGVSEFGVKTSCWGVPSSSGKTWFGTTPLSTFPPGRRDRDARIEPPVALHGPVEIGVVAGRLDRYCCRIAAAEGVALRGVSHESLRIL